MLYKRKIVMPAIFLLITIIISSLGYMWTEKLSFFDSIWLTVVSVLTIGYGDLKPVTPQGKIFTLIIIPVAIGLATYILAQFASSIIDGNLAKEVKKKIMDKKINKLKNHIIICGYGRVGSQVVTQLQYENMPFVIIEDNKEALELIPEDFYYVIGDAKNEQVLKESGVEQAHSMILTLPNDADNLFITLTAKGINPQILAISRAESSQSEKILYQAGVDKVINTSSIGGKRMAMSVLKPHSVDYVDTLLHNDNTTYSIEEIEIAVRSPLINKSLRESKVRELYGVSIVAIKRDKMIINNPRADERLQAKDLIIVFGSEKQLKIFEKSAL